MHRSMLTPKRDWELWWVNLQLLCAVLYGVFLIWGLFVLTDYLEPYAKTWDPQLRKALTLLFLALMLRLLASPPNTK
jgi:hypothetical protein